MRHLLALLLFVPSLCLAQLPEYVPTDSLVAWYPLNGNGSGGTFASGDAVIVGAQPTTDRFGNPEGAMMFDGNDNLSIPSSTWNVVSPQFSFSIWYYVNTPGAISTYIVEKGSTSGGWEYALSFEPNGEARFIIYESDGSGGYLVFQGGQIGEGWNHVGFSFDMDGTSFIALNDDIVSQSSVPNGTIPQAGTSTLNLGARRGWASHPDPFGGFNGALDDFAFWNRALTPSEMQAMYDIHTGCTDSTACNYNNGAISDDGSCIPSGCTEEEACNFNADAGCDDGSCDYSCCPGPGCCGPGMSWDHDNQVCVTDYPTDVNQDGCTTAADLVELLSFFGYCESDLDSTFVSDTTWACGDPLTYWDYDYATVLIGDDCWFVDNLQTELYSNGDSIHHGLNSADWSLDTASCCVYAEGDSPCNENCNPAFMLFNRGRLYNGQAVLDPRELCPSGWHVSTDGDWFSIELMAGVLEEELGNTGGRGWDAALAIRDVSGWASCCNGTNELGFAGQPGGRRNPDGFFEQAGGFAEWWTGTPVLDGLWGRWTHWYSASIARDAPELGIGRSIRCVKD